MTAMTARTIITIDVMTNMSVSLSDTTSLNWCPLIIIVSVDPKMNVTSNSTNVTPNVIVEILAAGTPLTTLSLGSRLRSPMQTAAMPITAATTHR